MIQIRPVDAQDEEVWRALLELRERYPEGWTLIGARMVTLYALEHGRTPPRFSLDADALINVRLIPRGTQRLSKLLLELDYELVDVSGFGHGHRFKKGGVVIDILAPDGLNAVKPACHRTAPLHRRSARRQSGAAADRGRRSRCRRCSRRATATESSWRDPRQDAPLPSMKRRKANVWTRRSCSRSSPILRSWPRRSGPQRKAGC